MAGAAGTHFRGISVENSLIVSLPVLCKEFHDLRIHMIAVIFAGFYCHTDTAVGLERAFERFICLKTYNGFFIFVQVARAVGRNGRYDPGIHIQNAAFGLFFLCQFHNLVPQVFCSLGRPLKKVFISVIGGIVLLDKVTNIDFLFPDTAVKRFPFFEHIADCLLLYKISRFSS